MNDETMITIGDVQSAIKRLREQWAERDRVDEVLEKAEQELERIRKERQDYYGSFGQ